jgi:hypothetical protein
MRYYEPLPRVVPFGRRTPVCRVFRDIPEVLPAPDTNWPPDHSTAVFRPADNTRPLGAGRRSLPAIVDAIVLCTVGGVMPQPAWRIGMAALGRARSGSTGHGGFDRPVRSASWSPTSAWLPAPSGVPRPA